MARLRISLRSISWIIRLSTVKNCLYPNSSSLDHFLNSFGPAFATQLGNFETILCGNSVNAMERIEILRLEDYLQGPPCEEEFDNKQRRLGETQSWNRLGNTPRF